MWIGTGLIFGFWELKGARHLDSELPDKVVEFMTAILAVYTVMDRSEELLALEHMVVAELAISLVIYASSLEQVLAGHLILASSSSLGIGQAVNGVSSYQAVEAPEFQVCAAEHREVFRLHGLVGRTASVLHLLCDMHMQRYVRIIFRPENLFELIVKRQVVAIFAFMSSGIATVLLLALNSKYRLLPDQQTFLIPLLLIVGVGLPVAVRQLFKMRCPRCGALVTGSMNANRTVQYSWPLPRSCQHCDLDFTSQPPTRARDG
jgi:hypothetical protein